jgi:WXG100 family type VII secretion target
MANMHVSYQEMTTEAMGLRRSQEQIKGELTTLAGKIRALVSSGFVTDKASVKFHENYEQFNRSANSTIDALDQIARTLEQTAATLQQADADIAAQMG